RPLVPGLCLCVLTLSSDGLQLQQSFGVPTIDLLFLFLRQIQPFNTLDRLARVQTWRGLKRHVGSEHDILQSKEVESTLRRGSSPEQRRVRIEILEILDRPFLHRLQQRHVIHVRRALSKLIPTIADASFEVRNHSAHVMRDDFQSWKLIEVTRKNKARHRNARFVGPAKGPPDFILRSALGLIVREIGSTSRMYPDRNIATYGLFEQRKEFRRIKRLAG